MFGPFTRFTVLLALPVSMNDRRAKSRKRRAAGLRIYRVECDEVEIEELLWALGYRGDTALATHTIGDTQWTSQPR